MRMRSAFSLSCRLSIRARSSLEALSWGGETGHSLRAPSTFTDYSGTVSLPTSLMAFLFPTDPQGLLRRVLCIQPTFPHSVVSTPMPTCCSRHGHGGPQINPEHVRF